MNAGRRAFALAVIAALLALAIVVDEDRDTTVEVGFGGSTRLAMPSAAPASALGSTWFCPGGTASGDGAAEAVVTVANPGERDATGVITVFPSEGDPVAQELEVGARAARRVKLSDVVRAPFASALVELDRGEVAAEMTAIGDLGRGVAPCASSASEEWHLANGVTTRDAGETLLLFNPFPDDAFVDFSFVVTDRAFTAPALEALVVPARSVLPIDLTEHVRREAHISASVVARTGRLVMGRIQRFDGSAGPRGLGLALAAPSTAERWWFPDGLKGPGLTEQYHVYNPTERSAEVDLEIVLDEGVSPVFELTLLPGAFTTVDVSGEDSVPAEVGHAASVTSLNGVPVVAERSVAAGEGSSRRGYESMIGAAGAARRWVLPAGQASKAIDEWLTVHNPGAETVQVSVHYLGGGRATPMAELQDVEIEAGRRRTINLGRHVQRPELPVVVTADAPVVVERDLYATSGTGLSAAIGIPLAD